MVHSRVILQRSSTTLVRCKLDDTVKISLSRATPLLIILCLGILAIALAGAQGALGIARADDWSYLSMSFEQFGLEKVELNGWVHMMFVTQGSYGNLLNRIADEKIVVFQMSTLSLGLAGLVGVYLLARWALPARIALGVLYLTGISPLWLYLSVTYMTDIPAWALSVFSVVLGVMALRNQRSGLLVVGACVALLAFGVREYAIIPFIALLVWVIWSRYPRRLRLWSLGLGIFSVAVSAVAYLWRQSFPGSVETVPLAPLDSLVLYSRLILSLALLLVPWAALGVVMLWSIRRRMMGVLRRYWLGLSLGVLVAVGVAFFSSFQVAGNVIHEFGTSWTSVGDGVRSLPLWSFRAMTLVAVLSLVVLIGLAGMLVQRRVIAKSCWVLERPQVSSGFTGLYVFICMAVMVVFFVAILLVGAPAFDRYLLLVVPLLGIVILGLANGALNEQISKWQKFAIAVILLVTGAVGIIIADGLNQVDGLRWQVASEMVESGIPAYKIDGGDAWFRYHQKDAPGVARVGSLENSIPGRTWWQTFFEGSTFCRMVAIESGTDLQAMFGPALSIREEGTLLGTPFRVMVFPGPDSC